MASAAYRDPDPVIRTLKGNGILNKHLQAMLRLERLSTSGVKAEMQQRVINQLKNHATRDPVAFDKLKQMIENPRQIDANEATYSSPQASVAYNNHAYMNPASQASHSGGSPYGQQPIVYRGSPNIEFKPSPFYRILKQIEMKVCDRMDSHRHQVQLYIKTSEHPDLLNLDPNTRVMVFCASGAGLGRQDIAFPHPSELKINTVDPKKNLRGSKNKPGTTMPVDITDLLRLKLPKYSNVVEFIYALTKEAGPFQKYYLIINLVKMIPVEDLVKNLAAGQKITKSSVLSEMVNKARDPDIVVGSSVLSLKCPLSTLRITLPCRATTCKHNQCFDATSYLQLQMQSPTWQCPICSNPAAFEHLAVDEYVREILMNTPKSADQVTIEPDGTWSHFNKRAISPPHFSPASGDDDDDDLIEIKDSRVTALRNSSVGSGTPNSFQQASTPPGSSREPSSSVGPQNKSNGKRAIIDLTLSDDDDAPIARPVKRVQYGAPNGFMSNGSPDGTPHRGGYLA